MPITLLDTDDIIVKIDLIFFWEKLGKKQRNRQDNHKM